MSIACNDGVEGAHVIADRDREADLAAGDLDLAAGMPCRDWPTFPADVAGRAPVWSDVPTLILAGELDPLTPPENARIAAATLARAQVFVLPMVGHGVLWTEPCAAKIVQAFLQEPARRPDVTCPPPPFDASGSLKVRAGRLALQHQLADAAKVLEQLLAAQEMRDPGSGEVAATLALLGAVYHEERRLAPAASAIEKALAILGKAHGLNSVEAGKAAGELADVYYDQARWAEALTMYRRALRALEHERADPKRARYERRERRLSTRLSG
jgi:tetratricopeptide (TPR) repeat protein